MRFMVLVPSNPAAEAGEMPSTDQLEAMTRYNEALAAAGVLRGGDGLLPTSRVRASVSRAADRPSSTARSPSPRSSSRAIGCGSALLAKRRSSG